MYDEKVVLENIWLAFFPGAKIGVLGNNGSGKSTLLRIMAGEDKDFMGTRPARQGDQDRLLPAGAAARPDEDRRRVHAGSGRRIAGHPRSLQRDQHEARRGPRPRRRWRSCSRNRPTCRTRSTHANLWELDRTLEIACDAMRLPPGDAKVEHLSGGEKRRVALCQLLLQNPDMLLLDEPTNHLDAESVGWLEQFLQKFPGTVVADHARPVLPRQRRPAGFSNSIAASGYPVRRQLHVLAGTEAGPAGRRREEGRQAAEDAEARTRMGPHVAQGPRDEEQGPSRSATKSSPRRSTTPATTRPTSRFPSPGRSGDLVVRAEDCRRPSATGCCSRI